MIVDSDAALPGEELGGAALRRDPVDLAEEIEDHPPSVRREVHGKPGPFLHLEIDLPHLAPGRRGIPGFERGLLGQAGTVEGRTSNRAVGTTPRPMAP